MSDTDKLPPRVEFPGRGIKATVTAERADEKSGSGNMAVSKKPKRNGAQAKQASIALARQDTSTPMSDKAGGELPEKLTKAGDGLTRAQQTFATEDPDLMGVLALQAAASLGNPKSNAGALHRSSVAAVRSLGARDGLEALLTVQMVGVHNLAMHFLANAAAQGQTAQGLELFTNSANRLLRTFTAQVEALKTYRSKGEQKVAVEHVHIHRGGQAIVGAVNHSATGGGDDKKD